MISNYFKIAWRNLWRNRLYASLNIAGLAVGLASGILVMLWVADELGYNRWHTNLPNIHQLFQNQTQGGVVYTFAAMPGPLSTTLQAEMPEIKRAARASWPGQQLLRVGETSFYERGIYVEPAYFDIFTFPAVAGDPVAALADPDAVVITQRTAKKFFGDENPMGKILRHDNQRDLKVGAVLRDLPTNSSLRFDVVLPFRIFEQQNADWIDSWNDNALPTYVELNNGANLTALNEKLAKLLSTKQESEVGLFAYPMSRWRLYGEFKNGKPDGGRITQVILLGVIGAFVLLIACINFMNLATARSERRAREVGVRKTMGAGRSRIVGQFLSEAILLTFLALGLGALLAKLALPGFNYLMEKKLAFDFSNWQGWLALLGLGLLTGVAAGSYPAFFLSRFKPVDVLKGRLMPGKKGGASGSVLRKGLVAFQFVISIFLIISTIVVFEQLKFAQNRPLGFDAENLIRISAPGDMPQQFNALKNDLLQIPGVTGVAASNHNMIQVGSNTSSIRWPGKTDDQDFLISLSFVSTDWTKTAGLTLSEGRDFEPGPNDQYHSCILNRTAVRRMGLKEPVIGTVIEHDTARTVVGIIEDFNYNDPLSAVWPLVLYPGTTDNFSNFFVRFRDGDNWKATLAQVEQKVKQYSPNYPFAYHFTKEEYQRNFDYLRSTGRMANVFGGLSIFICCLGLFGLSAFVAERRQKEISVRKVLGATVANICVLLSRDFVIPVLIAFALAAPLAAWAMTKMLARFEYHIDLSGWMFAAAGISALLITLATVVWQAMRAAVVNPAKTLRSE